MHPQTPPDRRPPDIPDWTEPSPGAEPTRSNARTGPGLIPTLVSVLVLVAIVVVIVLI
jgi:hypothetical protein